MDIQESLIKAATTTSTIASTSTAEIKSPIHMEIDSSSESNGEQIDEFLPMEMRECTSSDDMASIKSADSFQNRNILTYLARECDRFGVSDRCGASIANAVLRDYGIITAEDTSKLIDRNKLRRARDRTRKQLSSSSNDEILTGMYFDGKRNKVKSQIKIGDSLRTVFKFEEHITIVREPSSTYIGHFAPLNGTAQGIFEGMNRIFPIIIYLQLDVMVLLLIQVTKEVL